MSSISLVKVQIIRSAASRRICRSSVSSTIDYPLFNLHHVRRSFATNNNNNRSVSNVTTSIAKSTTEVIPSTEDDNNTSINQKKNITKSKLRAYSELAKARLSALVVSTTAAGYIAVGPEPLSVQPETLLAVLAGTALCSSSAAGLNQIFERQRDIKMKRTQNRPLVSGIISPNEALVATTVWGITGTTILYTCTDPLTTSLGIGNIILYSGIYTALKPYSITNTWIGAIVGAVPPIMGISAATGGNLSIICDPIAYTLGSILYLWQLPHFMALSYMYRADYTRGGFAMVPCHTITGVPTAEIAAEHTANIIVRYTYYLSAVPFISTALNVTSSMYALEGIALNAYALSVAYKFQQDKSNQNARKIFLTSLWYLPCTLMLFLLHSKSWDNNDEKTEETDNKQPNVIARFISDQIHTIRNTGRDLCLHETTTVQRKGSQACPVVVGSETVDQAADAIATTTTTNVQTLTIDTNSNDMRTKDKEKA